MTLPLSNIVTVNISRETLFPQGPGFGTLLIVGPEATGVIPLAERIRFYTSIDGVLADFGSSTEEAKAATAYFSANPRPTRLAIGVRDATLAPGNIGSEMSEIVDVSDDWYGVMLTAEGRVSDDAVATTELAVWVEARKKLHITATNEAAAIAAGGGLVGIFATAGYDRSMVIYHPDADADPVNSYPEAALFGQMLTVNFAGVDTTKTAKFKPLPSITVTPLTQNELDFLILNNGNAYVTIAGTNMFLNGTMASGEFFDIMHGIDWLQAEIGFRVFGRLATLPKVPLTNQGAETLANEVRNALIQGVNNGLLAAQIDDDDNLLDAWEVTVPSVLSQSLADRSARKAPPISFVGRVSGAVHTSQIDGNVTI